MTVLKKNVEDNEEAQKPQKRLKINSEKIPQYKARDIKTGNRQTEKKIHSHGPSQYTHVLSNHVDHPLVVKLLDPGFFKSKLV